MKIESQSSAAQSRKVEEGLKGRARMLPVDLLGVFVGKNICVYVKNGLERGSSLKIISFLGKLTLEALRGRAEKLCYKIFRPYL